MFNATALVYSSHNRCEHIHRDWIVERALKSHHNKTIFFLPMSMGRYDQQHYSWGTFDWYFRRFTKWGLKYETFFWDENLQREDIDLLFTRLASDEVVILGGGSSILGMERYRQLGEMYYGAPNLFEEILHERQNKGMLTVGFSAGADQLCEYIAGASDYESHGFGLIRNVVTTLHHEWGREGDLQEIARAYPNCMVFGLPNDSGLASDQGYLPSGNIWQVIEVIIDNTWDVPSEQWHVKTRSGMKVDHFYYDGRSYAFNNGDRIIRVMSPDNRWQAAWIDSTHHGGIIDYRTHQWSGYHSIEQVLAHH